MFTVTVGGLGLFEFGAYAVPVGLARPVTVYVTGPGTREKLRKP
jgi:hypothetical protein